MINVNVQKIGIWLLLGTLMTSCTSHLAGTVSQENVPIQTSQVISPVTAIKKDAAESEIRVEDVRSVQVAEIPAGEMRGEPLSSANEEDKKIIARIVEWIHSSQPGQLLAEEDETTRMMRPSVQLGIELNSGSLITMEPVCTENKLTHQTDCHVTEGLVYLFKEGDREPSAIRSPELASWLSGDYRYETVTMLRSGEPRAIGHTAQGDFKLIPQSAERLQQVGAPSCMGQVGDAQISGSYEMVFNKSDGSSQSLRQYKDFITIQPRLDPIPMRSLAFGTFEAVYTIPRYMDCHGLEFYMYGVQDGTAFPFAFQLDGTESETFYVSPLGTPKVVEGKLQVESGIAAGMDFPIRYTFQPDVKARKMVLVQIEEIRP